MPKSNHSIQREELTQQRRKVDFDTYDITVDELIRRVSKQRIDVAPVYQRQFRWGEGNQSRLIESLLLGVPVPPLFMATNTSESRGVTWEVVDGLQRLLTLVNFIADKDVREHLGLEDSSLTLKEMEILSSFNGANQGNLPRDLYDSLLDRPLKVIVLNDKSDYQVRFDLFDRLNTGGIALTGQEIREALFPGEFIDLLEELSKLQDFKTTAIFSKGDQKNGTPAEFVLRFFAFLENYKNFNHSVREFLNDFCSAASKTPQARQRKQVFLQTFSFLAKGFPDGINRKRRRITPVNMFEAIAVGAALALQIDPDLQFPSDLSWIESDEFRRLTTGATNDKHRVEGRIEFVRDQLLEA